MAGAEQSLLLLLRHLRGRVELVVACPAGSDLLERCRAEGVACRELPALGCGNAVSKLRCLRMAQCLRPVVKRVRPNIIHANNFHAMAIASFSRGLYGSGLIWHARDLPKQNLLARWCIARATRIVAVSKAIRNRLVGIGASGGKIDVVYNGIDPLAQQPPSAPGSNGHFTFACIGQIVKWKNQEAFIKAAQIVHRQLPGARFLLVGSDVFDRRDSYEVQIKAMIESKPMAYVQCIDWQKDMQPIWRQMDCLVHTAHMEPFGRVLIEAMAHGRPVVAFDCGGPAEIVANGKTGLLVPFGDVDALSNAMLRVAHDSAYAATIGQAAKRRVEDCFCADTTADGVMACYQKVFKRP